MPCGRRKKKSIIAMKGAPFTRKTEFATLIAASFSCPVLSLHDALDVLRPDYVQISPSSNTQLHDVAFQIICQMARSHLSTGISDKVVIDSPLSSRSHLDQLIELASSLETHLVIVQCKPKNEYLWETKFQEYVDRKPDQIHKWYKAKKWDDIQKAIGEDYDERSKGYKLSKLVLDPLLDYPNYSQPISPQNLSDKLFYPPPLVKAVEQLISRKDIVVYDEWQRRQQRRRHFRKGRDSDVHSQSSKRKQRFCRFSHSITIYAEKGLGYEANCTACREQIMGAAYTCENCSLALDKECAEPGSDGNNTGVIPILELKSGFRYRFPQTYACPSCKEVGKSFSTYCRCCLFQTHLRCRLMPTILKHNCEKHFLCIMLPPEDGRLGDTDHYRCAACGESGRFYFYSCNICGIAYHYRCLTERPSRVKNVHGGHPHHMLLKFSATEEEEDYFCDVCTIERARRDPKLWYYSCEECSYESSYETHLYCIDAP